MPFVELLNLIGCRGSKEGKFRRQILTNLLLRNCKGDGIEV